MLLKYRPAALAAVPLAAAEPATSLASPLATASVATALAATSEPAALATASVATASVATSVAAASEPAAFEPAAAGAPAVHALHTAFIPSNTPTAGCPVMMVHVARRTVCAGSVCFHSVERASGADFVARASLDAETHLQFTSGAPVSRSRAAVAYSAAISVPQHTGSPAQTAAGALRQRGFAHGWLYRCPSGRTGQL